MSPWTPKGKAEASRWEQKCLTRFAWSDPEGLIARVDLFQKRIIKHMMQCFDRPKFLFCIVYFVCKLKKGGGGEVMIPLNF